VISQFLIQGILIPWAPLRRLKTRILVLEYYDLEKKTERPMENEGREELRFRDHAGFYYAETHLGVDYKPFKYLAMGAEYQEIRSTRSRRARQVVLGPGAADLSDTAILIQGVPARRP